MLSEVICTEEFLGLVAFTKLVDMANVLSPSLPVCWVRELLTAEPTGIRGSSVAMRRVEGRFDVG